VISGYGKFFMGLLVGAMLVGGVAYSTTVNNTPEGGYLLCANNKTRVVTFPSKLSCPSGTKPIEVAGAFSASNDYAEESVEDSPTPATSKPTKNASARCNLDYLLQPNADVDAGVASCTPKELNNLIQQVSAVDDNPNLSVEQKKKAISVLTILVNAIAKKSK
jgi:hypothetical protein